MPEDKDALPSDREDGGLKPTKPSGITKDEDAPTPAPDDKKAEQDPSEQPS